METLQAGLKHSGSVVIDETLIVPAVSRHFRSFADMPPVFATAFLVGFVEWTCVEALRPHLKPGQQTVGTHVDLSHVAATPVGMRVTADVELVSVKDRALRFKVTCRDERDLISEGHHERYIIDRERFVARVAQKANG